MKKNVLLFYFVFLIVFSLSASSNIIDNDVPSKIISSKQDDPWVLPTGTQYVMPIVAIVKKNGVLNQPDGQLLGIFKNNICWGYTTLTDGPSGQLYILTAMYSTNNVTGFTYKVYDSNTNQFYDVVETSTFVKNTTIGTLDVPKVLNLKFSISRTTGNATMGTVSGTANGSFTSNTSISVTATPLAGYRFVNWTDGVGGTVMSTNAVYTFSANENRNLIANFESTVTSLNPIDNIEFSIFPNPVSNQIYIKLKSQYVKQLQVSIFSLQGVLIKNLLNKTVYGEMIIPLQIDNNISNGDYIVKVNSGSNHFSRMICINR
ncbi:MAG: InlB B-repeat-containing protein [Paludibacter sp.]